MFVKDYDLINNINNLFDKKIIIYGAGDFGSKTIKLLNEIPMNIEFFCDKNDKITSFQGYPVVSPDKLWNNRLDDTLIIIASVTYCEEIIKELKDHQVEAYVCTWFGVKAAIELNIENERFPENYQNDFINRKKLWMPIKNIYDNAFQIMRICETKNPILIYQPGKVGSKTLCATLSSLNIDNVHIHRLARALGVTEIDGAYPYFKEKINNQKEICKIISLVREPVGRDLSHFMQWFTTDFIQFDFTGNINDCAISMLDYYADIDYQFSWYDEEIKELTGIDIYEYPFDKEKGYGWIKKDNIEILILKLEKLDRNLDVINEFCIRGGKKITSLVNENVGGSKPYKYIYEGLKEEFRIPQRIVDHYYNDNTKVNHFYSKEEQASFIQKWTIE